MTRALRARLLLLSIALIGTMAVVTRFDAHPDEALHFSAATYYRTAWLPPRADDEVAKYLSPNYGTSYLLTSPPQAVYLLAAKIAAPCIRKLELPFYLGLRLCLVGLWLALVVMSLRPAELHPGWLMMLLATPQVWYVFTYFNGDAWGYFACALLVWQLGRPESAFRRFLDGGEGKGGLVAVAVPAAMLLTSKQTYLPFLGFAACYVSWLWLRSPERRPQSRRLLAAAGLALMLAAPLYVADFVRNGPDKAIAIDTLREKYGAPEYKPSAVALGTAYKHLGIRERGLPLKEVFRRGWVQFTITSSFGHYGYMLYRGPTWLYAAQVATFLALLGVALVRIARRGLDRERGVLLGGAALLVTAIVFASIWHSWTFDFQAQGRYLFSALPVVALTWMTLEQRVEDRLSGWLLEALAVMSALSFIWIGLVGIQ